MALSDYSFEEQAAEVAEHRTNLFFHDNPNSEHRARFEELLTEKLLDSDDLSERSLDLQHSRTVREIWSPS